jgi:hypothetical protein
MFILFISIASLFLMFAITFYYQKKQDDPKWTSQFDTLYEEIRLSNIACAMFNFIFIARRILIAFIIMYLQDLPIIQLNAIVLLILAQCLYLCAVRPYDSRE